METRYVSEFVKLAEVCSFSRAADELFISQSSLTKHIKTLESDLGYPLFDRTTRKIELSSFGELFLPYARKISDAETELRKNCVRLLSQDENTLRIGVLHAFLDYGMYKLIRNYTEKYTTYRYSLTEASTPDLFVGLKNDQFDVAIIRHFDNNYDKDEFAAMPLLHDPVSVIMLPGHPLDDGSDTIAIEALADYSLISSCSREEIALLNDAAAKRGLSLSFSSRIQRSQTVFHMLEQGEGPALILQKLARTMFGDKIRAVPISPSIDTTVSLVYRKNRRLSGAARSFIEMVEESGTDLISDLT